MPKHTIKQRLSMLCKGVSFTSKENYRIGEGESVFKKSSGILCEGNRLVVYRFIDQYKRLFGLRWLLSRLKLSANAYYNYRKDRKLSYKQKKNMILEKIREIYYKYKCIPGHRMMRVFLKREGICLSKTTVQKYMNRILNLHAITHRRKPVYRKGTQHKVFENLLQQNFTAPKKNQIWCTDFTYIRLSNVTMRYNCTIIDLYDRSVVASVNGSTITAKLAISALEKALLTEKPKQGLILHSDQGSQFTSWEFTQFCKTYSVTQSMSKAGCPYDNAPMERFYNTLKNELIYQQQFHSAQVLDHAISQYAFVWYNHLRPHSHNNYLTPFQMRFAA